MAVIKIREIRNMGNKDREEKFKELEMELLKARGTSTKSKVKVKEIKKAIARILTLKKTK